MHIVLVEITVKPEYLTEFKTAILDNAQHSILEEGILRFDVLQQKDNPEKFVLVEIYKDQSDHLAHRETEHYLRWRDAVADMLTEPRIGRIYENVYPEDGVWK